MDAGIGGSGGARQRLLESDFRRIRIWSDTPFYPQRGAADCKGYRRCRRSFGILVFDYLVVFICIWWYLVVFGCVWLYLVVCCGIWSYFVVFGVIPSIHMYGMYVWYVCKEKGQKLGFNWSGGRVPCPFEKSLTIERMRGWENWENWEGIERELSNFGDMVRSSELWRKRRVTPHAPHATIAEGSADLYD